MPKILKFTIVFILIFAWVFGYPPVYENFWRIKIWRKPPIPPEIQEAEAAVEIRYMRDDQHTVNGLTAYILGTTQSNTGQNSLIERTGGSGDTVNWGIRVWKRDSGGNETEITGETPVAQVSRNAAGEGIQSNTWACPTTSLATTDSIVVRVYAEIAAQVVWTVQATSTTEQLGAAILDSATWTVYYYTKYATLSTGAPTSRYTRGWFYWGTSTYDSRIENFTFNQPPTVSNVSLNGGANIDLIENTTTSVNCTATLSDPDGGDDITSATATIYRSGVGYNCPQDDNNCYPNITPSATSTSGNYFYATFTEDLWFHAEPTDSGVYSGETWQCYVIAEDSGGLTATNTDAFPPELNSLEALIITSTIDYGTLAPGATSSVSQQTTVTSTGNIAIDIKLKGTDPFSTNGYSFDASQQEYATSSVDYGAGTKLATTTYATLEVDLVKPEGHPSTSTDIIYWRIAIPADQQLGTYYSTTSAAATPD